MWRDILVFHILPKLPFKSLCRFKCVCKEWLQLISSDEFLSSMALPGIAYMACGSLQFLCMDGTQLKFPDPSLHFLERSCTSWEILSSCNGLLCIRTSDSESDRALCVCNPVTKNWSSIPLPKHWSHIGLAFDPLSSPHAYKLVSQYPDHTHNHNHSDGPEELRFDVFSSDTGLWTTSGEKVAVPSSYNCYKQDSAFICGVIYWPLWDQVVWFDTQRDLAGVLPPPASDVKRNYALGVWEDKLTCSRIRGIYLEAWVLIKLQWTKICQVSLESAIREGCYYHYVMPYQGGELLHCMYYKDGQTFNYYSLKTGEITKSQVGERQKYFDKTIVLYDYSRVRLPKLSK